MMAPLAKVAVLMVSLGIALARAGLAPDPVVTPAAILPRDNTQTLGWYSDAQTAGETTYAPWTFDADELTYTASGSYFRRCALSTSCIMYTSCSSGYMLAAGTSTYCGISGATEGASTSYCSSHVLLPTLSASIGAVSWYWCDSAPLTGLIFYAKEPTQPSTHYDLTSTTTSDDSISRTTNSSSSTSTIPPSITTLISSNGNGSISVGAIAGGVVGGVVIMVAIAFAIFWMMHRDKRKKEAVAAYQATPLNGSHKSYQPGYLPQRYYYAADAFQANDQNSQAFPQQTRYPQAYPPGFYGPHHAQQYAGRPSPQELDAPKNLPPQELPAEQR